MKTSKPKTKAPKKTDRSEDVREYVKEYIGKNIPDIVDVMNDADAKIRALRNGMVSVEDRDRSTIDDVVNNVLNPYNYQPPKDGNFDRKEVDKLIRTVCRMIREHCDTIESIYSHVEDFKTWGKGTQGQMNLYHDSQRILPITEYMAIDPNGYAMFGVGAWLSYLYRMVLQYLEDTSTTVEDCGKKYPPSEEFHQGLYEYLTGKKAPKKEVKSLVPTIEKPVPVGKTLYFGVGPFTRSVVIKGKTLKKEKVYKTEKGLTREKDLSAEQQQSIDRYLSETYYIDEAKITYDDQGFDLPAAIMYTEENPLVLSERQAFMFNAINSLITNAEHNSSDLTSNFLTDSQIAREFTGNSDADVRMFRKEIQSFMKWARETKIAVKKLEIYNEKFGKTIEQFDIEPLFETKDTVFITTGRDGKKTYQTAYRPNFNNVFRGHPVIHYIEGQAGTIIRLPKDAINTSRKFMKEHGLTFTDRYGNYIDCIEETVDSPVIKWKIMGILAGFEYKQKQGKAHVHTVGWEAIRGCLIDESEEHRSEQTVKDMTTGELRHFKLFVEHFIEYCHKRTYIELWEPWTKPGSKKILGIKVYSVHLPKPEDEDMKIINTPGRKRLQ